MNTRHLYYVRDESIIANLKAYIVGAWPTRFQGEAAAREVTLDLKDIFNSSLRPAHEPLAANAAIADAAAAQDEIDKREDPYTYLTIPPATGPAPAWLQQYRRLLGEEDAEQRGTRPKDGKARQ